MRAMGVVLMGMYLLFPLVLGACGGDGGGWTELLTNGGFETGDLTGWTDAYAPEAAGTFRVVDAAFTPSSGSSVAGPGEGTYYALSDPTENFAGVLFQYFTVPSGDDEVALTFDMFVLDPSGQGPLDAGFIGYSGINVENQNARVDILSAVAGTLDTKSGLIRTLYLDVDGYDPVLPYQSYYFDLSPWLVEGETYMLRFAQSSNRGYLNMGIDKVSVRSR